MIGFDYGEFIGCASFFTQVFAYVITTTLPNRLILILFEILIAEIRR